MRIIRSEKQKDNNAKYLYDISKICFAVAVIGPFTKPEIADKFTFFVGFLATVICYISANYMDNLKLKI